jgi:hypothetical protein
MVAVPYRAELGSELRYRAVMILLVDGAAVALLAVFVATAIGDRAADLVRVARHERVHRGTVYRVEDPPGTEAGLGWEPG